MSLCLDHAGSDLDLMIQVEVAVSGADSGVCLVPARLVTDIVRAVEPGAVSLESDDEELRIHAGRSQFAVRMLASADFPRLPLAGPGDNAGCEVTLDAGLLAEALRQVVRAASGDDARPILTGVLMAAEAGTSAERGETGLRLVATDSYRLAARDLPGTSVLPEGQNGLVPARARGELQRLLAGAGPPTLRLAGDHAPVAAGRTPIATRRR